MDAGVVDHWTLTVYTKSLQYITKSPDEGRKHSVLDSKSSCLVNRETRHNSVIV